jgi:hypothetical protein
MKNKIVSAGKSIGLIHDGETLTSAFFRNKLGEAMHARGLAPHIFDTRAEAEAAIVP